jgi:hypothetical protein
LTHRLTSLSLLTSSPRSTLPAEGSVASYLTSSSYIENAISPLPVHMTMSYRVRNV